MKGSQEAGGPDRTPAGLHDAVARRWDAFAGRLATASAVVTETMCLLGQSPSGPRALAKLVADSGMEVFDFCRETSPEP